MTKGRGSMLELSSILLFLIGSISCSSSFDVFSPVPTISSPLSLEKRSSCVAAAAGGRCDVYADSDDGCDLDNILEYVIKDLKKEFESFSGKNGDARDGGYVGLSSHSVYGDGGTEDQIIIETDDITFTPTSSSLSPPPPPPPSFFDFETETLPTIEGNILIDKAICLLQNEAPPSEVFTCLHPFLYSPFITSLHKDHLTDLLDLLIANRSKDTVCFDFMIFRLLESIYVSTCTSVNSTSNSAAGLRWFKFWIVYQQPPYASRFLPSPLHLLLILKSHPFPCQQLLYLLALIGLLSGVPEQVSKEDGWRFLMECSSTSYAPAKALLLRKDLVGLIIAGVVDLPTILLKHHFWHILAIDDESIQADWSI